MFSSSCTQRYRHVDRYSLWLEIWLTVYYLRLLICFVNSRIRGRGVAICISFPNTLVLERTLHSSIKYLDFLANRDYTLRKIMLYHAFICIKRSRFHNEISVYIKVDTILKITYVTLFCFHYLQYFAAIIIL